MTTEEIRVQLYDMIRYADDKKIEAIYTLLEDKPAEPYEWSEDEAFVAELDERYRRYEEGIDRSYTLDEVKATLQLMKKQRAKAVK
jgi:hypothetical protein